MTGAATFGTGMGERVFARVFVTSYQGQLSLAIPPCVGAMRSGDGCGNHKGKNSKFCVSTRPVTSAAGILIQPVKGADY